MSPEEARAEIHRLHILWQELEDLHRPAEADAALRRIERMRTEVA